MNYLTRLTLKTAFVSFALLVNTNCSHSSKEPEDAKDRAEDMNEEKFDRKEEKDADRIVDAYSGNIYEIKASENAASNASTAEVKKVASMMVAAHTKMKTDIATLASKKSITLPEALTDEQLRKLTKLTEKSGIDYDKEYIDQMKNEHDDAVKKLEKLADNAEDPELKSLAATAVPEIKAHMDMLKAADMNLDDIEKQNKDKSNNWKNRNEVQDGRENIPKTEKK
jgi:putative membrane protein